MKLNSMLSKPPNLLVLVIFFSLQLNMALSANGVANDSPIFIAPNLVQQNVISALSAPPPNPTTNPYFNQIGSEYFNTEGCCDCQPFYEATPDKAPGPKSLDFYLNYFTTLSSFYDSVATAYANVDSTDTIFSELKTYYSSIVTYLGTFNDFTEIDEADPLTWNDYDETLYANIQKNPCKNDYLDQLVTMCYVKALYTKPLAGVTMKGIQEKGIKFAQEAVSKSFNLYQACQNMFYKDFNPFTAKYCRTNSKERIVYNYFFYQYPTPSDYKGDKNFPVNYYVTDPKTDLKKWSIFRLPEHCNPNRRLIFWDETKLKPPVLDGAYKEFEGLLKTESDDKKKTFYTSLLTSLQTASSALKNDGKTYMSGEDYYKDFYCCKCLNGPIIQGVIKVNAPATVWNPLSTQLNSVYSISLKEKYNRCKWSMYVKTGSISDSVISGESSVIKIPPNTLQVGTEYFLLIEASNGDLKNFLKVRITTGTAPPAPASKDITIIRDIRCTMDKVELCVDVDVKRRVLEDNTYKYFYFFMYDADDFDESTPFDNDYVFFDRRGDTSPTPLSITLPNNIYEPVGASWEYRIGAIIEDDYYMRTVISQTITANKYNPTKEEIAEMAEDIKNSDKVPLSDLSNLLLSIDMSKDGSKYKDIMQRAVDEITSAPATSGQDFLIGVELLAKMTHESSVLKPAQVSSTISYLKESLASNSFTYSKTFPSGTLDTVYGLIKNNPDDTGDVMPIINTVLGKFSAGMEEGESVELGTSEWQTILKKVEAKVGPNTIRSNSGTIIVNGDFLVKDDKPKTVSISSFRENPYPGSSATNISNWILWDFYQDSEKMEINDLPETLKINVYVEKTALDGKDEDEITLSYFDEKSKEWKCEDHCLVTRADHNTTHDLLCGETDHLTTFVIAATEFGFDGSRVKIFFPILIFTFLSTVFLALLASDRRKHMQVVRINSEQEIDIGIDVKTVASPRKAGLWDSLKQHHNLISLLFGTQTESKSKKWAEYFLRWNLMTFITTLIFYGFKLRGFDAGATAWVTLVAFICVYLLMVFYHFIDKYNTQKATILAYGKDVVYLIGSIVGILVICSKKGPGFNDGVFNTLWIQIGWDIAVNQIVYTLIMRKLRK